MTGQAIYFHGPGHPLEIADVPIPTLHYEEILVRITACTLCRSDLHTYLGHRNEPTPTILGHEIIGRIEAFGPNSRRLDHAGKAASEGDRITWAVAVGCGKCFFCLEELPQKCERPFKYGHVRATSDRPLGGGLAEFIVLVPGTAWFRIPDSLSDAVATPANCATATVAAMIRLAGKLSGQSILIMGAGVLGVTAAAMARSHGARLVMAVDPVPLCRERAMRFGATHTFPNAENDAAEQITALTCGRGPDVVLELAGASSSVQVSLKSVRTGGTVILAGSVSPGADFAFDPERIVRRMLTIRGSHNYHPQDLAAALDFLAGPGSDYPFESLLAGWHPLDQVEEAFERAKASPGLRVGVVPP